MGFLLRDLFIDKLFVKTSTFVFRAFTKTLSLSQNISKIPIIFTAFHESLWLVQDLHGTSEICAGMFFLKKFVF